MRRALTIGCTAFFLLLPLSASAHLVPNRDSWRTYVLSLINTERENYIASSTLDGSGNILSSSGLSLMGLDNELNRIAQAHAVDTTNHINNSSESTRIATFLGHMSSNGSTFLDRIEGAQIQALVKAGENVGFYYKDPFGGEAGIQSALSAIHQTIMAELPPNDSQLRNVLGRYTHIGVGLELYNPTPESSKFPENILSLVVVFGSFSDDRPIVIPDETEESTASSEAEFDLTSPTSPYARFQRRIRAEKAEGRKGLIEAGSRIRRSGMSTVPQGSSLPPPRQRTLRGEGALRSPESPAHPETNDEPVLQAITPRTRIEAEETPGESLERRKVQRLERLRTLKKDNKSSVQMRLLRRLEKHEG